MSDLVAFLRARLDEDEASVYRWDSDAEAQVAVLWTGDEPGYTTVATGREGSDWIADGREVTDARHVRVLYDPARVLREVEAKWRIVDLHPQRDDRPGCWACDTVGKPCDTFRLLALPYSDHPDFDPAWAVDMSDPGPPTGQ